FWHHTLLLVLGAAWGLQFVLLKIATDAGLGEVNILLTSMALLAAGFLAAMAVAKAWFRPTWRHIRFFTTSGFLGFVLPMGCIVIAAREISAGLIVLFESLTPVFTILIALLCRTETITLRRVIAITFGLLGVFCILAPTAMNPGGIGLLSIGFALALPFIYGTECVYVAARWPNDLGSLQIVTGEAVAGFCLLLPCLFWMDGVELSSWSMTTGHWAIVVFVLISFLEAYLYFSLISRSGAVFLSLASPISMFAGIFLGIVLIGESHSMSVWLAVGLATFALYFALFGDCSSACVEEA
ncbi:MAG: DMT family transporter, partial [Geminicoccaceae bacterium]